MGVAYDGISSGSALFAKWKQSLRTEVHHFENFDQQPFEEKKKIVLCLWPSIKNGRG